MFKFFVVTAFISLSAGCAMNDLSCQFMYTDDIKQAVVLPFLEEKVGPEMIPFFNVDDPVMTDKGDVTRVVLSPIKPVDGRMVMYENSYVFIFENCSKTLRDAFEVVRN